MKITRITTTARQNDNVYGPCVRCGAQEGTYHKINCQSPTTSPRHTPAAKFTWHGYEVTTARQTVPMLWPSLSDPDILPDASAVVDAIAVRLSPVSPKPPAKEWPGTTLPTSVQGRWEHCMGLAFHAHPRAVE